MNEMDDVSLENASNGNCKQKNVYYIIHNSVSGCHSEWCNDEE